MFVLYPIAALQTGRATGRAGAPYGPWSTPRVQLSEQLMVGFGAHRPMM